MSQHLYVRVYRHRLENGSCIKGWPELGANMPQEGGRNDECASVGTGSLGQNGAFWGARFLGTANIPFCLFFRLVRFFSRAPSRGANGCRRMVAMAEHS